MPSARQYDTNGWPEIKRNPISKVGVFPYSGAQISPDLPADQVFYILRPADELGAPDCLKSFKLLPFVDDHTMLGPNAPGLTPAEEKGIHGVIGEEVEFDGQYIRANLKVFSDYLAANIQAGKREVSSGYRCRYDMTPGVYEGVPYDGVQREIRGNHLALVEQGRMGPDVAVLDHSKMSFSFDAKEAAIMPEPTATPATKVDLKSMPVAEFLALMKEAGPILAELKAAGLAEPDDETAPAPAAGGDAPGAAPAASPAAPAPAAPMAEDGGKAKPAPAAPAPAPAMDEATIMQRIAQRDELANTLSAHVGAFDHKGMTLDQVAAYGVEKLELAADKGHELATLRGFLAGASKNPRTTVGTGADSAPRSGQVDDYITGKTTAPAA